MAPSSSSSLVDTPRPSNPPRRRRSLRLQKLGRVSSNPNKTSDSTSNGQVAKKAQRHRERQGKVKGCGRLKKWNGLAWVMCSKRKTPSRLGGPTIRSKSASRRSIREDELQVMEESNKENDDTRTSDEDSDVQFLGVSNPHDDGFESDVQIIENPSKKRRIKKAAKTTGQPNSSEDDEICLVGTIGTNALVDYPHLREDCVVEKFVVGKHSSHCSKCYCYVCDLPADQCQHWDSAHDGQKGHCHATRADPKWRAARDAREKAA
ncbi:expressed unknown protein [Seminavis robusta]|uniref:Uncharacterized protein n=1 Tax=Seminavis robusta TaxID=568900 RepID=A0A9N8EU07_9STRA|nr:expressed unknown protein [Seminavis robusta]|eukprot:Sro1814_g299350.1 n/a (263) ;mRNA; f:14043-14831